MAVKIKTILSENQKNLLRLIGENGDICSAFYLSGGTALAEFYLHHRLSEDLDFFAEKEFDPQNISIFFKSIQKKAGIKKIAFEQSFNRNLFFLHLIDGDIIKTEFTYFPFPRVEKTRAKSDFGKVEIDSLLDIAVNKIFTIYQKPRSRDFIDLYFVLKKEKWTIGGLVKKAKVKFDWHIDPIQLGSQFLQAGVLKDYPRMIEKIDNKVWQGFFIEKAKELKEKVLRD